MGSEPGHTGTTPAISFPAPEILFWGIFRVSTMLRVLGCQEGSGMERARGVHEWGEHISPAKHYKVRERQQQDSQQGIPERGTGKKSGPAAPGLLGSGSLLGAFSQNHLSSSSQHTPNPGRPSTPEPSPQGPRAGTSCAAGEQGQASLENKWPETPSLCGQGQNPSKFPSGRTHTSRGAWAVDEWGSQADFSQIGEIWLKFNHWLMFAAAEGWIPQGHTLPIWPG